MADTKTPVNPDHRQHDEDKEVQHAVNVITGVGVAFIVVAFIWVVAGVAAFITSLVCVGYSGSPAEKIIGLLLSIFLGPFYWLYFAFNRNYCGSEKPPAAMSGGGRRRAHAGRRRR